MIKCDVLPWDWRGSIFSPNCTAMSSTWVLAAIAAIFSVLCLVILQPYWLIKILARTYSEILWFGPGKGSRDSKSSLKPRIFLTIDDAPSGPRTMEILELLRHNEATATFFCIGSHMEHYPSETGAIVRAGHSIGNHTMFDRKSIDLSAAELEREIKLTETLIDRAFAKENVARPPAYARFFRPGHGFWNETILKITRAVRHLGNTSLNRARSPSFSSSTEFLFLLTPIDDLFKT